MAVNIAIKLSDFLTGIGVPGHTQLLLKKAGVKANFGLASAEFKFMRLMPNDEPQARILPINSLAAMRAGNGALSKPEAETLRHMVLPMMHEALDAAGHTGMCEKFASQFLVMGEEVAALKAQVAKDGALPVAPGAAKAAKSMVLGMLKKGLHKGPDSDAPALAPKPVLLAKMESTHGTAPSPTLDDDIEVIMEALNKKPGTPAVNEDGELDPETKVAFNPGLKLFPPEKYPEAMGHAVGQLAHTGILYAPVFGTDNGSVYHVVAVAHGVSLAARWINGVLSMRAEGASLESAVDGLAEVGFKLKIAAHGNYCSAHYEADTLSEMRRVVGAVILSLPPGTIETPLPNVDYIVGHGK